MGHLAFPPGVPCFVQCIFPSRLPARHQRLPRTAARPASAERRRGQLRRGHRLSATPHPPGNGKAGRARPGPGIGRRPATGLGPRFRLCRPTAQDQRQRAHRIPRRRPVQATDRQRDPATGRTRPTLFDAPLQDTLREFYVRSRFHADQSEADRAITFRRLLSHQSGLPGEHLPPLFGERPSSLGQLPAKVSGVWLSNPPGTQVAYSNLGYELVGAAIERNTGKHFEQHMREHLLDPLQMTRSSFARNALPQAQRAHGYSGGGGGRPAPLPPATSRSTTCGAARSTSAASSACCSPTGATRSASFSGNTPSRRCSASRTPAMPWTSTARWAWPGSSARAAPHRWKEASVTMSTPAPPQDSAPI